MISNLNGNFTNLGFEKVARREKRVKLHMPVLYKPFVHDFGGHISKVNDKTKIAIADSLLISLFSKG